MPLAVKANPPPGLPPYGTAGFWADWPDITNMPLLPPGMSVTDQITDYTAFNKFYFDRAMASGYGDYVFSGMEQSARFESRYIIDQSQIFYSDRYGYVTPRSNLRIIKENDTFGRVLDIIRPIAFAAVAAMAGYSIVGAFTAPAAEAAAPTVATDTALASEGLNPLTGAAFTEASPAGAGLIGDGAGAILEGAAPAAAFAGTAPAFDLAGEGLNPLTGQPFTEASPPGAGLVGDGAGAALEGAPVAAGGLSLKDISSGLNTATKGVGAVQAVMKVLNPGRVPGATVDPAQAAAGPEWLGQAEQAAPWTQQLSQPGSILLPLLIVLGAFALKG